MGKSKELAELGDVVTQDGGNVGIHTSSPARNLVVKDSTMASIALQTDASGATLTDGLQLQTDSSNAYVWNYENTDMLLGTNNTTRMTIDASGRVTMPYQPSFHYHGLPTKASNGTLNSFAQAKHNIGSHYNNSTGRFTATVDGRYWFSASSIWDSSTINTSNLLYFYVNGATHIGGNMGPRSQTTITTVLDLNASDYVQVYANGFTPFASTPRNWFSGHLIG